MPSIKFHATVNARRTTATMDTQLAAYVASCYRRSMPSLAGLFNDAQLVERWAHNELFDLHRVDLSAGLSAFLFGRALDYIANWELRGYHHTRLHQEQHAREAAK